jgi:hypothetical protein
MRSQHEKDMHKEMGWRGDGPVNALLHWGHACAEPKEGVWARSSTMYTSHPSASEGGCTIEVSA